MTINNINNHNNSASANPHERYLFGFHFLGGREAIEETHPKEDVPLTEKLNILGLAILEKPEFTDGPWSSRPDDAGDGDFLDIPDGASLVYSDDVVKYEGDDLENYCDQILPTLICFAEEYLGVEYDTYWYGVIDSGGTIDVPVIAFPS